VYQEILDSYPDTEAAKVAEGRGTKVTDSRVDRAQEQFAHAQQFEKTNSLEEARAEYQGVIDRYPETESAKQAKELLKALNK
jgi:TolA-binding protein